jgi:glycosyltransferase involved in cell wall biosynthesis
MIVSTASPRPLHPPTRPLRVVLDLEKLRHANCGLGRFCRHLADGLLALRQPAIEPVLFASRDAVRGYRAEGVAHIEASPWRKEAVARLYRPLVARWIPRCHDLWHVTNQTSKYLPLDPRVPVVLTIHDLNFLHDQRHRGRPQAVARKLAAVQRKIDRSAAIVTDSRFVAADVEAHLRLGSRPIHVVPPGVAPPVPAAEAPPAFAPREPFLLSVGNALPHKNFHALFGLLERLPGHALVIAGKCDTPYGAALAREVAARNLGGRVVMPGQVTDADRQWLYERCAAFVFPSLAEGFGFPVLEAMQCGRPVFMARRTSLPEVAGDLGFYWDSFDPDHMHEVYAAGLRAVAADRRFADKCRGRAASFSWEETVRGYLAVYAATRAAA